ncbi:MAG: NAD+ synthase [Magnetococcales bacterium]|nr:NAD+ synthase [Magnetococcales bacterium]
MEFTLAMIQVDPHVGALEKNSRALLEHVRKAKEAGADLAVFPELALTGYPPEDLLHKPLFLERLGQVEEELHRGAAEIGIDILYGSIRSGPEGLWNVGLLIQNGVETGMAVKWRLPNYGVFDERRYFQPGTSTRPFDYRGIAIGVTVCEDIWHTDGPLPELARGGAELILNLNASPFHMDKRTQRLKTVTSRVQEHGLPIVYVNLVGGQDELVFDGDSFAMDRHGEIIARSAFCREDLNLIRVRQEPRERSEPQGEGAPVGERAKRGVTLVPGRMEPLADATRELYQVLCTGLAGYVRKNGFDGVVLGLSGGIDSALTAVICADALGPQRVEVVMMPSPYTSPESLEDAADGARRLGIRLGEIPIGPLFDLFQASLKDEFAGYGADVTEENIQPRIRATLLMAISNKKRLLLVTTGNKSEISVGYATLYGDMAGGFSVLKDLLKEGVYRLARARNQWAQEAGEPPPVPERIIDKPPSAELKPDQKDTDSLPPYPVLDQILQYYVEQELGLMEIVNKGIDRATAARIIRLVDQNEYKRRQASPGVRVTRRAFGKDRRYPITNGFRVS